MQLFNGKDLRGWKMSDRNATPTWKVENGTLVSPGHGPELITDATFEDFKMHIEFGLLKQRQLPNQFRYFLATLNVFGELHRTWHLPGFGLLFAERVNVLLKPVNRRYGFGLISRIEHYEKFGCMAAQSPGGRFKLETSPAVPTKRYTRCVLSFLGQKTPLFWTPFQRSFTTP